MLFNQLKLRLQEGINPALFPIEKQFAIRHQLIDAESKTVEAQWTFSVIELCLKETEEVIERDATYLLQQPIHFLRQQIDKFLYVSSDFFQTIGVDGLSLEIDDVFQNVTVLLGLKLPRKEARKLTQSLDQLLDEGSYRLSFNGQENIWELNLTLEENLLFQESATLLQTIDRTYQLLFQLRATIEGMN